MSIIYFFKKLFKIYIIFLFLFLVFSCRDKKQAYMFYNPDYFYVYNNEYSIYKFVKKKLNRNFYNVNELLVESFSTLSIILQKDLNNKKSGFFYITDFLTPLILKDDLLSTTGKYKLLTYNLPMIETDKNNLSIFNIKIDSLVFKDKIIQFIKRFSKKNDLSDCGLLVNTNYSFPFDFISLMKKNNLKLNILSIDQLNNQVINEWINRNDMKAIMLFGYEFNNFLINSQDKDFQNIIFAEFKTKYGEVTDKIKYNISINWNLAVKNALGSVEFNKFINNENEIIKFNYFVKNKNIILIEKYKKSKKLIKL